MERHSIKTSCRSSSVVPATDTLQILQIYRRSCNNSRLLFKYPLSIFCLANYNQLRFSVNNEEGSVCFKRRCCRHGLLRSKSKYVLTCPLPRQPVTLNHINSLRRRKKISFSLLTTNSLIFVRLINGNLCRWQVCHNRILWNFSRLSQHTFIYKKCLSALNVLIELISVSQYNFIFL